MRKTVFFALFFLLLYTRVIGLNWGLPYPMHPDERNMANAMQNLRCDVTSFTLQVSWWHDCLNPHFFAYGQLPLYLGNILIQIWNLIVQKFGQPISFNEATMSLRMISAAASVVNAFILLKIIAIFITVKKPKPKILNGKQIQNYKFTSLFNKYHLLITLPVIIFSPYFIQFSHFGTTESLLMLFYTLIIYLSLNVLVKYLTNTDVMLLGLVAGLAIGLKISSIIFIIPILFVIFYTIIIRRKGKKFLKLKNFLSRLLFLIIIVTGSAIVTSPYNVISLKEFIGSMQYESSVATGVTRVFYTRQFENSIPILFQIKNIFPFVLGWPQYVLAILGFILLSWRDPRINLLRISFIVYFIPAAFLYTKWTRFMTPIFPVMTIFAALFLILIYQYFVIINRNFLFKAGKFFLFLSTTILIVPGMAYLSIYQNPDVRFKASEWIYENIPDRSYLLSETANVVDIPLHIPAKINHDRSYQNIKFNFYDLDASSLLQQELARHLEKADYIIIPSRRIFMNHSKSMYPKVSEYYEKLFSGELGFKKVAEITSYPRINLFGKTLVEFPDEKAEETWTVFDHPVVRIYKRINPETL